MSAAVFFYYGPSGSGKSYAITRLVRREHTAYINPGDHFWPLNDNAMTDIVIYGDAGFCTDCIRRAVEKNKSVHVETNRKPTPRQIQPLTDIVGAILEFQTP